MAKSIVLDTDFFLGEKLKNLSSEDAYYYIILKFNPWVSKCGIYRYPGESLIEFLGYKKFLTDEQINAIDKLADNELGEAMSEKDKEHKKNNLASLVLKKKIRLFSDLTMLKYDPDGHIIFFPDYNKVVPVGGNPAIVVREFLNSIENLRSHPFWFEYWQINKDVLIPFFRDSAEKTKDQKFISNYNKLKIIFKF